MIFLILKVNRIAQEMMYRNKVRRMRLAMYSPLCVRQYCGQAQPSKLMKQFSHLQTPSNFFPTNVRLQSEPWLLSTGPRCTRSALECVVICIFHCLTLLLIRNRSCSMRCSLGVHRRSANTYFIGWCGSQPVHG